MISRLHTKKISVLTMAAIALQVIGSSHAAELDVVESRPLSQLWVNAGMLSYHYEHDKHLNGVNPGLGIEYQFSTTNAITTGIFYNSDREYSRYVGIYWHPVTFGPVRMGMVAGAFDGYPKTNHGGWFPAVIPVAAVESKKIGVNIFLIPPIKDRLYGAISFQLKYKLIDK